MSARGEFTPKTARLIFFTRDHERCFRCGRGLVWERRGLDWSVHHRRPRGAGGTSLPWVGKAANGLTLCGHGTSGCHGYVESHREESIDKGWLISMNGIETAADVPVLRFDDVEVWLTNWGSAVPVGKEVVF